jgi:hypothetical protein
MKYPFIGLTLFFMVSVPIAAQATDFQIDKIVNEALEKAHADQSIAPNSNVTSQVHPSIVLSDGPSKNASPAPINSDTKTQKTDLQNNQPKQN